METIYFNLIKQGLISFIQAIHDRAVQSDAGVITGFVRNSELSDSKKKTVNKLIRVLYALTPEDLTPEGTDADLKETLEDLIYDYRDTLQETCMITFNKNEGATEKAMSAIYALITEPYIFLKKTMGLENFQMDNVKSDTPQTVLAYFCARYKVEHILDRTMAQQGFSENSSGHPKLSKQKEDLFVNCFLGCNRFIAGLKEESEDYNTLVRDNVLETIKSMKSQLTSLCRQATTGTQASVVSFKLFGSVDVKSSYTPDEGTMKDYLIAADTMIKNKTSLEDALNPKTLSTEVKAI